MFGSVTNVQSFLVIIWRWRRWRRWYLLRVDETVAARLRQSRWFSAENRIASIVGCFLSFDRRRRRRRRHSAQRHCHCQLARKLSSANIVWGRALCCSTIRMLFECRNCPLLCIPATVYREAISPSSVDIVFINKVSHPMRMCRHRRMSGFGGSGRATVCNHIYFLRFFFLFSRSLLVRHNKIYNMQIILIWIHTDEQSRWRGWQNGRRKKKWFKVDGWNCTYDDVGGGNEQL